MGDIVCQLASKFLNEITCPHHSRLLSRGPLLTSFLRRLAIDGNIVPRLRSKSIVGATRPLLQNADIGRSNDVLVGLNGRVAVFEHAASRQECSREMPVRRATLDNSRPAIAYALSATPTVR